MAKGFISIKFNEASLARLNANLVKLDLNTKGGAKKAIRTVATNIMAQSQSEVPRETETLRSTAYIEQPKVSGRRVSINLGYASPVSDKRNPKSGEMASEYAMYVHETPGTPPKGGNYHPYGKWKYLEDPAKAHQAELISELGQELSIVCSKGVM